MSLETERLWCFQDALASVLTTLCAVKLAEAVEEYKETSKDLTLVGFINETSNRSLIYGYITSFIEIVRFWKEAAVATKYLEKAPQGFFTRWNVLWILPFLVPLNSSFLVSDEDNNGSVGTWVSNIYILHLSTRCISRLYKERRVTDTNTLLGVWTDLRVNTLLDVWWDLGVWKDLAQWMLLVLAILNAYTSITQLGEWLPLYWLLVFLDHWIRWQTDTKKMIKLKINQYASFPRARLEFFLDGVIVISGTLLALGLDDDEWGMVVLLWWRLIWLWRDNHRALWFSGGESSEQEIKTITGYTLLANIVHIFFVSLLPWGVKSYLYLNDKKDQVSSYTLLLLFLFLEITKLWVYWTSAFGNRLSCCKMSKACFCLFLSRKFCGSTRKYPQFVQQVGLWDYRLSTSQQVVSSSLQRVKYVSANKDLAQPLMSEKCVSHTILDEVKLANPTEDQSGKLEFSVRTEVLAEQNTAEENAELLMYFELAQEKIWLSLFVMVSYIVITAAISDEWRENIYIRDLGLSPLFIVDVYALYTDRFRVPRKRARLCTRYGTRIPPEYEYIRINESPNSDTIQNESL